MTWPMFVRMPFGQRKTGNGERTGTAPLTIRLRRDGASGICHRATGSVHNLIKTLWIVDRDFTKHFAIETDIGCL